MQSVIGARTMLFTFLAALAACQSTAIRPEKGWVGEFETMLDADVLMFNKTVLFFGANLDWMVVAGFGSRVLIMGAMHEGVVNGREGRVMVMPQSSALTWNAFDLYPPVTIAPLESFEGMNDHWPQSGRGQWLDQWAHRESSRMLSYQVLAGCRDGFDTFIWQMFEKAITNFDKPFDDYIGMHIRHGSKATEGPIYDLGTFMSLVKGTPHWKDKSNLFVATDDAQVLQQATQNDEYQWSWNDFKRQVGGDLGHDSSDDSIRAVLDDTLSLALAPVLIGNFNSNFVKLPWVLNYLRRTPEQRLEQWCWDVFTDLPCHSRHDFIVDFVREAIKVEVAYRPESVEGVRDCESPSIEDDDV